MGLLILGLILFLGMHSVRIVADEWRTARRAAWGEARWKGLYTVVSLLGFVLIVMGYGATRALPVEVWTPPVWTRHLSALLTLPAFVLLAAAYVPGTRIKAAVGHPMVLSVKLWAAAHLLANGRQGDVLLFGAFLVWSVFAFRACRQRDRAAGVSYPARPGRDLIAVGVGLLAWAVFAFWAHAWLIGVRPFGGA